MDQPWRDSDLPRHLPYCRVVDIQDGLAVEELRGSTRHPTSHEVISSAKR